MRARVEPCKSKPGRAMIAMRKYRQLSSGLASLQGRRNVRLLATWAPDAAAYYYPAENVQSSGGNVTGWASHNGAQSLATVAGTPPLQTVAGKDAVRIVAGDCIASAAKDFTTGTFTLGMIWTPDGVNDINVCWGWDVVSGGFAFYAPGTDRVLLTGVAECDSGQVSIGGLQTFVAVHSPGATRFFRNGIQYAVSNATINPGNATGPNAKMCLGKQLGQPIYTGHGVFSELYVSSADIGDTGALKLHAHWKAKFGL